MNKLFLAACILGSAFAGHVAHAAVVAPAPIVKNGSFENGLTGWSQMGTGTTPGIGITVRTTGGTDTTGYGDSVPNFDGTHAAYFVDDNAKQYLYQSVVLAANTAYRLTFSLFATASGAANPFGFSLLDGYNNTVLGTHLNSDVPVGQWTTYSNDFSVRSSGNYDVGFLFQSGATPAKDVLLDAVSITAVPEPMSLALLGAGLAGMAMVRRKRA